VANPIAVADIMARVGAGEYRVSAYGFEPRGLRWEVFVRLGGGTVVIGGSRRSLQIASAESCTVLTGRLSRHCLENRGPGNLHAVETIRRLAKLSSARTGEPPHRSEIS